MAVSIRESPEPARRHAGAPAAIVRAAIVRAPARDATIPLVTERASSLLGEVALLDAGLLPAGALGIDAGLTLTKTVRAGAGGIEASSCLSGGGVTTAGDAVAGVTGARAQRIEGPRIVRAQEIDAAARGARAMLAREGVDADAPFVLALLGTGTAFAAVTEGRVMHLGGTALGGGSFAGIARRIGAALTYEAMIAGAARGDRTRADMMVSDAYAEGIGRIGPDLTAAHLAKPGDASSDDVLASLLNLHGENIAQIAAQRARAVQIERIVLAGGFAHGNARLVESIAFMAGLFGVSTHVVRAPGYAGAVGAALIAVAANEVSA